MKNPTLSRGKHCYNILMHLQLNGKGTYIIAVSGGVDSMVLLHLLKELSREQDDIELVVAHLDHGIRQDSALDRELVGKTADKLSLKFFYEEAKLGSGASEALAREFRYGFLYRIKDQINAGYIVTAHHQDDMLETAVINILRGTGRKGLTSLKSSGGIIRPLLEYSKADIKSYAVNNGIEWREDSTNSDTAYLRNYIRHNIIARLDNESRAKLAGIIEKLGNINNEMDGLIEEMLDSQNKDNEIDRVWFSQLPHNLAREVLATWLRNNGIRGFDRKTLERLVVAGKTGKKGRHFEVIDRSYMDVYKHNLALDNRER
jgi:tRNA(Ile)-lysidine synthase